MEENGKRDAAEDRRLEALRLEYEYVRGENLRLRDGRAALTRQLGPLPISAAIVAGLVTGFTGKVHEEWLLLPAGALFLVLVGVSILYAGMKPYRVLRDDKEVKPPRPTKSPTEWYTNAIELEKKVYGQLPRRTPLGLRAPKYNVDNLQDGYDRERSGLFIVQTLFAVVVILLILSRVL